MALPPKWYQFLISVFASLGSVLFGYDLGIIAEVVASQNFVTKFKPTSSEIGAVVSVFTGGAFVGAALAGPAGDWLGRRKTILLGAIIFLLGGGLQTGAQNLGFLYSGRCIAGLGVGFLVMIIPPYQAEVTHPSIRGRVTSLQQFMLGVGALVAAWLSYGRCHPVDEWNDANASQVRSSTLPTLTRSNGASVSVSSSFLPAFLPSSSSSFPNRRVGSSIMVDQRKV